MSKVRFVHLLRRGHGDVYSRVERAARATRVEVPLHHGPYDGELLELYSIIKVISITIHIGMFVITTIIVCIICVISIQ